MRKRVTPTVPIQKDFRNQMQFYWNNGSRDEAFTVFLMKSCPESWTRYISQLPELSARLESLEDISGFQVLLIELIRSTPESKLNTKGDQDHDRQLDDFLFSSIE